MIAKMPVYKLRLVRERTQKYQVTGDKCHHDKDAGRAMHSLVGLSDVEQFAALLVDSKGTIVGAHVAVQGQRAGCSVAMRDVFKAAIVANASAVILGHNHPSGDPVPSVEDLTFNVLALAAANVIGIPILDHVIVSPDGASYSMFSEKEGGFLE